MAIEHREKVRYSAAQAMPIAKSIMADLVPFCGRIAIAGSLRREKQSVGDIEILFVPLMGRRKKDMFDEEDYDLAADFIDGMLAAGVIAKRPNINGGFSWGAKNKLAIHVASGIPVDFFATTDENWWVTLVVRTGSAETNLKLTTGAQRRGGSLVAYGCGVRDASGNLVPATSERHVFELCGISYLDPKQR